MPYTLRRYYGKKHLHFITFSCYRRLPRLGTRDSRDLFVATLEEIRSRYQFAVLGYVVMPEHVHLLLSEPANCNLSIAVQVLKQRVSRGLNQRAGSTGAMWQRRWYDFNVFSEKKRVEKLRYMHRNPVTRGLVEQPDQWPWSSFRWYLRAEIGGVKLGE